ncbi:MAG: PAS domain-containing sensor histidine kinase [Candidatus Sericytochromatia bacterium]
MEEFQLFFASCPDLLCLCDAQGRVHRVNPAFEKLLQVSAAEVEQRPLQERIHPNDQHRSAQAFAKLANSQGSLTLEARLQRSDNSYIWVSWTSSPLNAAGLIYAIGRDISADKRIREQLQHSSERLTYILDNMQDAFMGLDSRWCFTHLNRAGQRMLNRPLRNVLGQNIWQLYPEARGTLFFTEYDAAFKTQKPRSFENFNLENAAWYAYDVYPSPDSLAVFFRDVTENKLNQAMLSLEREMLARYASTPQPLHNALLNTVVSEVQKMLPNLRYSIWLGEDNDHLERVALQNIPSGPSPFLNWLKAAQRKPISTVLSEWGDLAPPEWPSDLPAGWFLPLCSPQQQLLGWLVCYFNKSGPPRAVEHMLTERTANLLTVLLSNQAHYRSLQQSNQRYEMISQATNDTVWDWDIGARSLYWGPGIQLIYGYDKADLFTDYDWWLQHIHPEDRPRIEDSVAICLRECEVHWEAEYRFVCADGSWRDIFDRASVIYEKGRPVRMIGAMQDITSRKRYETALVHFNEELHAQATQLASSNRDLERFAYIASHDLQEPLRMVSSFLQLLVRRYEGQLDDTAHKYIHFAVDGAERMKRLIEDLLVYSRISHAPEDLENVSLQSCLEQVQHLLRVPLSESQAEISAAPLPTVKGHRLQLEQLLQNLLGNAIKYRHPDRPLRIHMQVHANAKEWIISMNDNGIGIEAAFFEKIFIIFQRLHNKSEYSGTGIGLALCKKIVERHGGRIGVESEPGIGSRFWFTLPRIPESLQENAHAIHPYSVG